MVIHLMSTFYLNALRFGISGGGVMVALAKEQYVSVEIGLADVESIDTKFMIH